MGIIKKCQVCGKEFGASKDGQKTCSIKCRSEAHKKQVQLVCEQCGKEFSVPQSIAARSRFCSRECYWKAGGAGNNTPNSKRKALYGEVKGKYKTVYIGRDENNKPLYMRRSHFVWNQTHPDDPIQPGETIHHKDRDRSNDDPDNLEKMDYSSHMRHHANEITSEERSRRMKNYREQHPEALRKGEPKICPVCGIEFYRPPSAKAITCSYECMGKLRTMQSNLQPCVV